MKVRAFGFGDGQCGYFGHIRRYNGDVFEIPDEPTNPKTGKPLAFSTRWMEEVESATPVNKPSSVKSRQQEARGKRAAAAAEAE